MPAIILTDQKTPYDGSIHAKIFDFLGKLQRDDTTPGLHIEPMRNAADPRARTGRVDKFWRAVLFKLDGASGSTYVVEGFYPHDEAIERARTRKLQLNPVNGLPEFLDVDPAAVSAGDRAVERAERLMAARNREIDAAREKAAAAIAAGLVVEPVLVRKGYLLNDLVLELGFSPDDAERLLAAEHDAALTELVDEFENAWQELAVIAMIEEQPVARIAAMLRGEGDEGERNVEVEPVAVKGIAPTAEPVDEALPSTSTVTTPAHDNAAPEAAPDAALIASLTSPAARRQFHYIDNQDELRRAIESLDFGQWTVYLHPDQERYVRTNYRGAFRLTGGAGTGKTVVLLHRARRLALENPNARVVLTTFTRALSRMLTRDLKRLDPRVPIAKELGQPGVYIGGVDQLVAQVRSRNAAEFNAAAERVIGASAEGSTPDSSDQLAWDEAIAPVANELGEAVAHRAFLEDEYVGIVLRERVTAKGEYLRVPRPGRGQRLGRLQRAAVWQAVEQYRRSRRIDRRLTFPELAAIAASSLESTGPLADHVLIDEGQDLVPPQWQFLRALAAPGPNDLFIAEDAHQRIYGRPVVMAHVGIDLRGRSRRLRLNYRTTQETLDFALRALQGRDWIDSEGETEEAAGYVSARRGPEPRLIDAGGDQLGTVAKVVAEWIEDKVAPPTIAVLVRRRSEADKLVAGMKAHGIDARFVTPDTATTTDSVLVMTMHSAKGQEFSRVVLYDLSASRFPLRLRANAPEEERGDMEQHESALLYVSATRARDELVVTYSGELTRLL